jgi:hypothetical protein
MPQSGKESSDSALCGLPLSHTNPSPPHGSAAAPGIEFGSRTSSFTYFAIHIGRSICAKTNLAHSRYILTGRKVCSANPPQEGASGTTPFKPAHSCR